MKNPVRESILYDLVGEERIERRRRASDGKYYPFDYLVCAGRPGDEMSSTHIHNIFELLYCYSGNAVVLIGKRSYIFGKGDLVVICPDERHCVTALDGGTVVYSVLQFDPGLFRMGGKASFDSKYIQPYNITNARGTRIFGSDLLGKGFAAEIIRNISSEYHKKDFGFELSVRADISKLFMRLLRIWKSEGAICERERRDVETEKRLERIFGFVEQCYPKEISAVDACAACGMSYSYFSRFFKRETGMSFTEYLNSVRIIKAENMLTSTDKSVTEIAMDIGFSSSSYFIAKFKESKFVSPGEFRKMVKRERL